MREMLIKWKQRYQNDTEKLLARVKYVSRFRLDGGRLALTPRQEPLFFDAVNIDINNTCNLRCRFCFNVFDSRHVYMTEEIFSRVLPVISQTRDVGNGGTGVYLFCLYEPSLSPQFLRFLEMLPMEGRKKVFFTSNFCRPWKPEQISQILDANLHHINISVETFREDRYEAITSSKHFQSFYKNLNTLASLYEAKRGYRPKLRYITMILRINRDEISEIVRECSRRLHAWQHELRTPYISVYANMAWNREQLMEPEECRALQAELDALHLPIITDIHSRAELVVEPSESEQAAAEERRQNNLAESEPETLPQADAGHGRSVSEERKTCWDPETQLQEIAFCMHQEYLFLRFHPDGTCTENVTKETAPVPEAAKAKAFYEEKLRRLYRRRARAFRLDSVPNASKAPVGKLRIMVEELTANEVCLTVRGWCRIEAADSAVVPQDAFLLVHVKGTHKEMGETEKKTCSREESVLMTSLIPRPDLKTAAGGWASGFVFCAEREETAEASQLEFWLTDRRTGEVLLRFEYPYVIRWKR